MKKLGSSCARCAECKYLKHDCPQWYTTRLVPELHGDVLVRSSQGRPI